MVQLRPIESQDKNQLFEWRNRPEVSRNMFTDHSIGADEHSAWFEKAIHDTTRKMWIVQYQDTDVGFLSLYDIKAQKTCDLAIYIGEPGLQGRGIGTAVEYLMLQIAFTELKVNRLCAQVFAFNEAALCIHKKFGFHEQAILPDRYLKSGKPAAVHQLFIEKSEWEKLRPQFESELKSRGLIR